MDFLCSECFTRVHSKGSRRQHSSFSLDTCHGEACRRCATVVCSATRKKFCFECYTSVHLPTLPLTDRKLPVKIDYQLMWQSVALSKAALASRVAPSIDLDNDWYPFFDKYGVLLYHNFRTKESYRRNPAAVHDDEEPVGDECSDVSDRICKLTTKPIVSPFT